MITITSRLLSVAVLFATVLSADPPRTGSIEGSVTDENDQPVASATITARHQLRQTEVSAKSDGKSEYRIVDLVPGVYSLRIVARGYCTQSIPRVTVAAGEVTRKDLVLLALKPQPTCPAD